MLAVQSMSLMVCLLVGGLAPTGQPDATLRGVITSAGGRPVAGASVRLEGTALAATSDPDGGYAIAGAPPGTYSAVVELLGFLSRRQTVVLPVEAAVDFELEVDLLKFADTVVVSATSNPVSVLESSVAVTTLDADDVMQRAPLNTADLFKSVPGLWVESSVGQAFNDIFVRGIPTGGQSRFLSIMEDGLPLFPGGDVAFFESDQFLRLDDTLERFEAIRGGSSAVLASNAPGGILNVISRTGGSTLSGNARVTTGSTALARADAYVGGPLGRGWFFNIGGFARRDGGVVDPGFVNDSGWQVKGNLTRAFGTGVVRAYVKGLRDRNYVNVGGPYTYRDGELATIPGYDLSRDSFGSPDLVDYTFPLADGSSVRRSIADGSHVRQYTLGTEVRFTLGRNWLVSNLARIADSNSSVDFDLDFAPPMAAVGLAEGVLGTFGQAIGATGYQFSTVNGSRIDDPAAVNGNGLLSTTLPVFADSSSVSVINQLEVRREFDAHAVTGGFFFSTFDLTRLLRASTVAKLVTARPPLVDLTLNGSPLGPVPVSRQGFLAIGNGYQHDQADARIYSLYGTDTFTVGERLRLDIGLRYERHAITSQREDTRVIDLDGNPLTVYDASYLTGTGQFTTLDFNLDDWSGSVGVNYMAAPEVGLFARVSRGFNALILDRDAGDESMSIRQVEAGARYSSRRLALSGNLFHAEAGNVAFTAIQRDAAGNPTVFTNYGSSRTLGIELETVAVLNAQWGLRGTATLQAPKYTDFGYTDIRQGEVLDFDGRTPARQPNVLVDITGSHQVGPISSYASVRYYGRRFANDRNTVVLAGYAELHGGASWTQGRWVASITGANLLNARALTTGNPRYDDEVAAAVPGMLLGGRANLSRNARLSLGVRF